MPWRCSSIRTAYSGDLLSFDDLYYDTGWDGLWRVRTTRSDSEAEIAIPWQTLRYPGMTDTLQNWGATSTETDA